MILVPSQTLAVISAYPDGQCDPSIIGFLAEHGFLLDESHLVVANVRVNDVVVNHNTIIGKVFLPSKMEHLLFIEKDIGLGQFTELFLEDVRDVVCVKFNTGRRQSWLSDGFHTGMFRTRREVLQKVTPPWFMTEYSQDGTAVVKCLCMHFADKARAAGFTVGNAGLAHHTPKSFSC